MSVGDVLLLLMAVILPPLPVAIKRGFCSGAFWLNLLLSLLAFLPGMIHAWYIVLKHPEVIVRRHVVHHVGSGGGAQQDLERNPISGTYPGAVYGPVASGGNMAGVYGDRRLQIESGKAGKQGGGGGQNLNYGTVDANSSQQPPAYSPQ